MRARDPRRPLNPLLIRRAITSGISLHVLFRAAGWVYYPDFYRDTHDAVVVASPLRVGRLQRFAQQIGFPLDEIFLDEPVKRVTKRAADEVRAEPPIEAGT